MNIVEAAIYFLENKISATEEALIVFLICEIFFNTSSSIFYKNWKGNWRIMPEIIENHLLLQCKFKRFNDVIWLSLGLVFLGVSVLGYNEPIQVPICVFGIAFTFLMHQWCAYIIGGIKQTCLDFSYDPTAKDILNNKY